MLDDARVLLAWERCYGQPPYRQAIILLAAAFPDWTEEQVTSLSIGERDQALLRLRRTLFGNRLQTLADCPQCKETLEISFSVDDIMVESDRHRQHRLEADEHEVEFRLPNSRDLAALASVSPERRVDQLIEQCITSVRCGGQSVAASSLSPRIREQVSSAIGQADPRADVRLELTCAACDHKWASPFDIIPFLWDELNACCHRLLAEIHSLAKAYGWSEQEILSLSRWRRHVYLNMARQ